MVILDKIFSLDLSFFKSFGYLAFFLALFIESFPFIGALIPGGIAILLVAGFLVKLGLLNIWWVLIVCSAASISVDLFGYCLGRFSGRKVFHKLRINFLLRRKIIERVGRIVHGHTGKSLILGRFNPVTRSIAPFIVGTEKVGFWKFMFFNIVGGVSWVSFFVLLGFTLGDSLTATANFEKITFMILVILAILFYGSYLAGLWGKEDKTKCRLTEDGLDCKE